MSEPESGLESIRKVPVGFRDPRGEESDPDPERFRTAFEYASVGMAILEPNGRILEINRAFAEIVGRSKDELVGLNLRDLIHPADRENERHYRESVLAGEQTPLEVEHHYLTREGGSLWVRVIQAAVPPGEGRPARLITQIQDVTELHQTREPAQRFLNELERSNRELEEFARVASHDLQEPLRKVLTFGEMLDREFSDELGEEGKLYVCRMRGAASRMRGLIDDLLTYSRVSATRPERSRVDLTSLVEDVLSDFQDSIDLTGAEMRIASLPALEVDERRFRQLFQNLIGNALKYRRAGVPPRIEIEVEPAGSSDSNPRETRITVRDNGIGFEEKHADRIFGMFERLHGRGQFEGTGVGLALCKRIVEQHGGRLEAHGKPDQGASFIVTLPVAAPAHSEES